ncbi:MAG: response regulator [Eubacteriales bacterium]|nr:response regulator [Eubacteriales bacterium]
MYKILLADNEGIALDSLKVIIEEKFPDTCDVRTAKNISQLTDTFHKYNPDILLINIQMTGVRGISTIREFHYLQKSCLFLIVSHTGRVNFQREGEYLGVLDYLKKPVSKAQMTSSISNAISILTHREMQEAQKRENKEKMEIVLPILESGLVSRLLLLPFSDTDPQAAQQIGSYCSLLNISDTHGWVMLLQYGELSEEGGLQNLIGATVRLHKDYHLFRQILRAFFPTAIVGPALSNQYQIVIPCKEEVTGENEKEIRSHRIAQMLAQMDRRLQLYFQAGFGSVHTFSDLQISLNEAFLDLNDQPL